MAESNWRRSLSTRVTTPVARALAHTPITPNFLSWFGFAVTCGAAALIALEQPLWGGIVMLVAGLMDTFDGALARYSGKESRFGAVLDSTLDRFSEGVILLAVLYVFAAEGEAWQAALAGAALMFSFAVSYIRARTEGAGVALTEGWFTRPERVIILALGLIFNLTVYAMAVVAALSLITAVQRLFVAWRRLRAG